MISLGVPLRSGYLTGMHTIGRALQMFGLVIGPMALIYYFSNKGLVSEARLMFGELSILAISVVSFCIGNVLLSKES